MLPDESSQSVSAETWDAWEAKNTRLLHRLSLILVAFGVCWRIGRYLMAMPIWGDEAMLLVNYQTRGYADIFGPIDYCQIAPLLFHWAEITAIELLGSSELSVRLPPLLASLVGLALFCLFARWTLSPLPRMVAIGVLSVAIWPATTGSLVKPYSWDLLFSVALLLAFAAWRRNRDRHWPAVVLCALVPIALAASYTAVFVAGAVGMAMAPAAIRSRDRVQLTLFVLYCLLVGVTFLAHYEFVGKPHLASVTDGISTAQGMTGYWQDAFPPADPVRLLIWLPSNFAGEIAAYPAGGKKGASLATLLISVVGAIALWRKGNADLVCTFAGILFLWLVAAFLHKYPFGSCRLGQHAAPVFCLLFGAGTAQILRRFVPSRRARHMVIGVALLLLAIGIGGVARDIVRPFRDLEVLNSRTAVNAVLQGNEDPVLVGHTRSAIDVASIQWYLGASGNRVHWQNSEDWHEVVRQRQSVWVVVCLPPAADDEERRFRDVLSEIGGTWTCTERQTTDVLGRNLPGSPTFRAYRFARRTP